MAGRAVHRSNVSLLPAPSRHPTQESAMKAFFEIKQDVLVPGPEETAKVTVYTTPDEAEKQHIVSTLDLPRHDVESALDPDEISRVDITPDYIYIIWKR